jgi:hypothetical protein
VRSLLLEHQPHAPLSNLRRIPASSSFHGSILSRFGASGLPGAIQEWPLDDD